MRPCPYCDATDARVLGKRGSAIYVRCRRCRSIYRDLTALEYDQLHAEAFTDADFLGNIASAHAGNPDRKTWRWLETMLPAGPLLEIGPGSGHLLAAARERDRDVYGVEASALHRKFISETWGIRTVYATLDELPRKSFAAVVAVNTIEHVFDVGGLFRALRALVGPGGAAFLSTCNAEYVLLPLIGMSWTMFKVPDHVSIPSAEGFRRLASRTGFDCRRTWTGELPLETPIAVAAALRDGIRERWHGTPGGASMTEKTPTAGPRLDAVPLDRRLARLVMKMAEHTDPVRHVNSLFGRAAAIRGLFVPAADKPV